MKVKRNWNKTVSKLLFKPKQPWNVVSCLANHSQYSLFMQNCCLWCSQSNFSQQTWRSYALL